jgi:hypothetical protein
MECTVRLGCLIDQIERICADDRRGAAAGAIVEGGVLPEPPATPEGT